MMAIGVGILTLAALPIFGMAAISIYGLGLGLTIPTVNLLAAKINPARSVVALNYLNLFWGLGAVLCPFLIALSQRRYQTMAPLHYGLAFVLFLLAFVFIGVKLPDRANERSLLTPLEESPSIWSQPLLPILAGLFFLYVATESGVAGWIAYHADRSEGGRGALWVIVPAFFWGALLLGRATGHLLLRFVLQMDALRIHLLMSTAGIIALVLSRHLSMILTASIAVGLGLSTVFPFYIHILSKTFGSQASEAGSILFVLAGLGGACGPSIVGLVSQHFSLATGFLVPLFGCLLMVVLCAPNWKWWHEARGDVYSRAN